MKTTQKIDASNSLWQKRYFDGLGRVVQLQAQGETGKTIVTTTAFSNRGLTDKEYVPQNLDSSTLNGYKTPETGWKYTSYQYDGLNRVTTTTKPDNATISHDYTTAWQDLVTNERGLKKRYYYDAFNRLGKVEELNDSQAVYATTNYAYDVLNNLTQVQDNSNNTTTVAYDWLSRKTSMTDPDMGSWSYSYDSNSNLLTQNDARSQLITFSYDVLNRLTGKTYPAGSGMTNVTYSYDSTSGGNFGKGKRTGMTDAPGSAAFTYDTIGRLIKEDKTIASAVYTTQFSYDSADRLATVTYPGGEVVTQGYNGRGLPYSLSSGVSGTIVSTSLYNQLGQPTEINLGNGLKTSFGYWDVGGSNDTTGGYYSKLWEIKTFKTGSTLQDVKHTWDAGGNLTQRVNVVDSNETESFSYDFLDRLMTASGASAAIGSPLTDGLAARWNLDEGSGTAANDSSGNGNNGVLTNGPAWVDGKLEKALSFDGIDDIVTVADATGLKFGTGDFTVALWVLTIQDATALGKYPIAINKDDEQAPRSGWTIYQSMANNGMNFAVLSGGVEVTYNSGVTINDGKWHHLVLRKTSTGIQGFIDGELKGTASGSVGSTDKNTPVRIGNGAIAGRQWNGKIDEVRIYNRALSGEEINRLYGLYSERYTYNAIGNLTSKNGIAYTYGSKPHAVTQVGTTSYAYDNNGNMITRGSQTLTWDVENRPISVNTSPTTSFVYDGDGKRVKKAEGVQTTVYANKYYEKNLTTGDITLYYYLGDRMVALKKAGTLRYVSQDHLTGTSVTSDTGGNLVASIKFFPFGATRAATGTIETEKKFTGQYLDSGVDLYYYGARYYDANIGRFISADTVVSDVTNPQAFNRYSYVINNPVRFTDPTGHFGPVAIVAALSATVVVIMTLATTTAYYSYRVSIYERKTGRIIEIPDLRVDLPNSFNMWPNGPPKLGWLWKAILATTGVGYLLNELKDFLKSTMPEPRGDEPGDPQDGANSPQPSMPASKAGSQPSVGGTTKGNGDGTSVQVTDFPSGFPITGTDAHGTTVALVSVAGGAPEWKSIDEVNQGLGAGKDIVYVTQD